MALSRRDVMVASFAGSALAATSACAQSPDNGAGADTLVIYFTRSGNTRVIARSLARTLHATLAEIVPANPYPEGYEANVALAEKERQADTRPPLAPLDVDPANYRTIFLGFPIWGMTAPAVIRSFLTAHDLSGRTVAPFVTHGGYGIGNSIDVIHRHAPQARHIAPFILECDQERRTIESVNQWLENIDLRDRS